MGSGNRTFAAACTACVVAALAATSAAADHRPVIAVPGRADVPVVINGMPATGALVTGDWGLYAPGRVVPQVYDPAFVPVDQGTGYYYPRTGRPPRHGRQEVVTPHAPRPAQSFHREWSSESDPVPATRYPPYYPPPIIMAPDDRFRQR